MLMRTFFRLLISFLFFYTVSTALGDNPLVAVGKTARPPVIDGKLNDSCWRNCLEINNFLKYQGKCEFPTEKTKMRIIYDDKFLYLGIESQDRHLNPVLNQLHKFKAKYSKKYNDTLNIFKDESIELFIAPNINAPEKYYHICLNSLGAVYDSLGAMGANKWNSGLIVKSSKDEKAWYLEIAIPLGKLSLEKIIPGKTVWKVNFCRNIRSTKELSSWNQAAAKGFHDSSIFGTMKFTETVPGMLNVSTPILKNGVNEFSADILNTKGNNSITLNLKTLFDRKENVCFGDRIILNGRKRDKLLVKYNINTSNHIISWDFNREKDPTETVIRNSNMMFKPETEYKFRAMVKTDLTRSGKQKPYNFFLIRTKKYCSINATVPMKTNGWQQVYGTYKTGKEVDSRDLWVVKWAKRNIKGRLEMDNLSLTEVETGLELIKNGDFEKGPAGWTVFRGQKKGYGYAAEKLSAHYSLTVNGETYYRSPDFFAILKKENPLISSKIVNFGHSGIYPIDKLSIAAGTLERINLVIKSINSDNLSQVFFEIEMPRFCRLTDMSKREASIVPLEVKEREIIKNGKTLRHYLIAFDGNAVSRSGNDKFNIAIPLCFEAIAPWNPGLKGEINYRAWIDKKQQELQFHNMSIRMLPPLMGRQPVDLPLVIWGYPSSQKLSTLGANEQEKFTRKQAMAGYNLAALRRSNLVQYSKYNIKGFTLLPTITVSSPGFPFVREFLKKYPAAGACYPDGKLANAIDPAYLLSKNCKFLPYVKKVMEVYSKYYKYELNWDYEFGFIGKRRRAKIGYSKRNLELFRKTAQISAAKRLNEQIIMHEYRKQWIDFRCSQIAQTTKIYRDCIKQVNPDCKLSFYSGYPPQSASEYGCKWKYVSQYIDLPMCGYGGNNENMIKSIKQNYFISGVLLMSYSNQLPLECLFGRFLTEAGSYLSFVWFVLDGRFFLASSRMAAIASDFEHFFLNLKGSRKDHLVSGSNGIKRDDIRVLVQKNERLVFVFNNTGNIKKVEFKNRQLPNKCVAIDYDTKKVYKNPTRMTVELNPWRVKVIYITDANVPDSIPVLRNSTISQYPILRWTDSNSAKKKYQLQYSSNNDFSVAKTIKNIENCYTQIKESLPAGKLFWRVRNINAITKKTGTWTLAQSTIIPNQAPLIDFKRPDNYRNDCFGRLGYWTKVSWGNGGVSLLTKDYKIKRSGIYSLKCENLLPASHSFWTTFYRSGTGSKMPFIKPGEKYSLSAWIKTSREAQVNIGVDLLSLDGVRYRRVKSKIMKNIDGWEKISCTITTDKECLMVLKFNVNGNGSGWCSDIKLGKLN